MTDDRLLPGEHPHKDQSNWRPEDDELLEQIDPKLHAALKRHEAGERLTQDEWAKAVRWSRKKLQDTRYAAYLPNEFFELCLKANIGRKGGLFTQLARLYRHLQTGDDKYLVEREYCPHCDGLLRTRMRVQREMIDLWNAFVDYEKKSDATEG